MSGFGIKPILVTVDKSVVTEGITTGTFSSTVHSVTVPGFFSPQASMASIKQISVLSEDAPTSWAIAFFDTSGAGDAADLDNDSFNAVEVVTANGAAGTPTSGLNYYSNSDLNVIVGLSPASTTQGSYGPSDLQLHFQVGTVGAAKTAGASGEMVIKIWLEPLVV